MHDAGRVEEYALHSDQRPTEQLRHRAEDGDGRGLRVVQLAAHRVAEQHDDQPADPCADGNEDRDQVNGQRCELLAHRPGVCRRLGRHGVLLDDARELRILQRFVQLLREHEDDHRRDAQHQDRYQILSVAPSLEHLTRRVEDIEHVLPRRHLRRCHAGGSLANHRVAHRAASPSRYVYPSSPAT